MKTVLEILREARQLVEKGWSAKYVATGADGKFRDYASPEATNFCMNGAVWRACWGMQMEECGKPGPIYEESYKAIGELAKDITAKGFPLPTYDTWTSVAPYNDAEGRTKEQVLAVFDQTIARLEAEAKPKE